MILCFAILLNTIFFLNWYSGIQSKLHRQSQMSHHRSMMQKHFQKKGTKVFPINSKEGQLILNNHIKR